MRPDQFEAYVPASMGPCHLAAAGGIAADVMRWHDRLSGPTEITPIGLLGNARGQAINLKDHALPRSAGPVPDQVFAVFGTSMNAGKTTTAAALVKGFHSAGYPVGAAKVTGTGAGGDLWMMRDFGATHAYDFTDAGHATTFRADPEALVDLTQNLLRTLGAHGCRVAVLEVADGLYQAETAALAASKRFRAKLSGTFFAAGDAMGAVSGAGHLRASGHNVLGVSGGLHPVTAGHGGGRRGGALRRLFLARSFRCKNRQPLANPTVLRPSCRRMRWTGPVCGRHVGRSPQGAWLCSPSSRPWRRSLPPWPDPD